MISLFGMSMIVPLVNGFIAGQTTAGKNDAIFEGVAGNDNYDKMQYSYKVNQWQNETYPYTDGLEHFTPANTWYNVSKSLRIGMTEYGEFATSQHAGIAYGANAAEWTNTESWASINVDPKYWIQGWALYVKYIRAGTTRQILGYAEYSDLTNNEGARHVYSWLGNCTDLASGTLIPSGVEILYDSARLVVSRCSITIHDGKYNEDFAKVTLTLVYQKDTKYAIVYKDVKILLDPKVLDAITDLSFDERYELDLARHINTANRAFIHYFANYEESKYEHPLTGSNMTDVIQAFDPQRRYIYFSGIWPNATEFSVHMPLVPDISSGSNTAYTKVLPFGFRTADIPNPPNEPSTPWVTVQWRYNYSQWPHLLTWLAKNDPFREIRFVEVIGMTDYNKEPIRALDINATDGKNQVDSEVQYLLHQVFNQDDQMDNLTNDPFMWVALGQSSATTDNGAAAFRPDNPQLHVEPFVMFDRNDTLFPWTAPVIGMKGTIPYGLEDFGGNYIESFSNSAKGTGTDTSTYKRTMLKGFVFGVYDGVEECPPQPIAGGYSYDKDYWYPSKDPLTERWSPSWSIDRYDWIYYHPNGIYSLGGPKANGITRYFNDYMFAIQREGVDAYGLITSGGSVIGTAPTSDPSVNTFDYFPISTWNSSSTFGYKEGYAVIAIGRDVNGTRGMTVYGWDGRDTYWAGAWASQFLSPGNNNWIPSGVVALVLHITYPSGSNEPDSFTIVKASGSITELGYNQFAVDPQYGFDKPNVSWNGDLGCIQKNTMNDKPTYPTQVRPKVWWWQKLPTWTIAEIDYDA